MPASLEKLERIVSKNPTSILFARLAERFLLLGQVHRAFEICRLGLKYRPSYVAGHIVMGKCHLAAGRLEEARSEFQKVLQLNDDNLAAYRHLGEIDLDLGWPDLARRHFEAALVLDPFNSVLAERVSASTSVGAPDPGLDADGAAVKEEKTGTEGVLPNGRSEASPAQAGDPRIPEGCSNAEDGATRGTLSRPQQEIHTDAEPGAKSPVRETESDSPSEKASAGIQDLFAGPRKPAQAGSIATVTLAELYAAQGQIREAVQVLLRVLEKDPDNSDIRARIATLRSGVGP